MNRPLFSIADSSLHPIAEGRKSAVELSRAEPASLRKDHLRYVLWLLLANTANANRRHFGLPTTWIPHLAGNSLSLLLPDVYRFLDRLIDFDARLTEAEHPTGWALHRTARQLALNNPDYVEYVAPAAFGYIVSHPQFNIYRGGWARLNIYGLGLDSIPHVSTAYAITRFLCDALATLDRHLPAGTTLQPHVGQAVANKELVTGIVMAALTLGYEAGEYLIHKSELRARDHDRSRINMMWSLPDSLSDAASNTLGWALAILRDRTRPG